AFELAAASRVQCIGKLQRLGQVQRRNHLLDVAKHQVDDDSLEPEKLTDAGDDDLPDLGPSDDLLHRAREILDDDDQLGTGVDQLMLELACRIQRVYVHDRAAGTNDSEQTDRILEDIG